MVDQQIIHTHQEQESIKLSRNAKGDYAWEIKVKDNKIGKVTLDAVEELNKEMKLRFIKRGKGGKDVSKDNKDKR